MENAAEPNNSVTTTDDICQTDGKKKRYYQRKRPMNDEQEVEMRSGSQNVAKKSYLISQNMEAEEELLTSLRRATLKLQKPTPFFEGTAVFNNEFVNISINDYKGRYLVLFFYPLDFTFVCPTEIIAFSERISEFHQIGCEIVGCSTDSEYTHLAWMNTERKKGGIGNLKYPLLSDKNMSISRSYGVLDEDTGVPFRGLFIIDRIQNLRQIIVNDLPIGRSVDEVLRLVKALQFHEQHGEVCPIDWMPGRRTIVLDPTASLEFFKYVE